MEVGLRQGRERGDQDRHPRLHPQNGCPGPSRRHGRSHVRLTRAHTARRGHPWEGKAFRGRFEPETRRTEVPFQNLVGHGAASPCHDARHGATYIATFEPLAAEPSDFYPEPCRAVDTRGASGRRFKPRRSARSTSRPLRDSSKGSRGCRQQDRNRAKTEGSCGSRTWTQHPSTPLRSTSRRLTTRKQLHLCAEHAGTLHLLRPLLGIDAFAMDV